MRLVSIITPTYNTANYIEELLISIKNQSYKNIEHIVIDDGSTDNTKDILNKYSKLYNLKWYSKNNEGQVITISKCFNKSKGDIIIWINSDDVLFYNDIVEKIAYIYEKNDPDVIYSHMAIIDKDNYLDKIQSVIPNLKLKELLLGHFGPFICYRRNIFEKYPLDNNYKFAMDYEQSLRMAKDKIVFYYLNDIIIGYRRHKNTKSNTQKNKLKYETIKLREIYGYKNSINNYFNFLFLYIKLYCYKVVSIKYFFNNRKNAFNIKNKRIIKLIINQLIPYFT